MSAHKNLVNFNKINAVVNIMVDDVSECTSVSMQNRSTFVFTL